MELGDKIVITNGPFRDRLGYIDRIFGTDEYHVLLGDVMIKEWLDFLEKGENSEYYDYFKKEKGSGIMLRGDEMRRIGGL